MRNVFRDGQDSELQWPSAEMIAEEIKSPFYAPDEGLVRVFGQLVFGKAGVDSAQHLTPPEISIQIEVESLDELQQALDAEAKLILLDNFDLAQMCEAVQRTGQRAVLEASGGITLENVRAIAETGVQRISIGSLTKHVQAVDLSLRVAL